VLCPEVLEFEDDGLKGGRHWGISDL
jgi:hypothetical protein